MNPSDRLLEVMEYMMAAGAEPVKQIDIARDLNIAPATLNRIIKTLSERGYLFRTSEKYCVSNFRLLRNVPMSEGYLSVLNDLMNQITSDHKMAVEAVVASGFDLLWHSCTTLPDATVAIRARNGFRRNLYELDALSRLYLGRIGWDEVSYKFFPGGFFETGVDMDNIPAATAREVIEDAEGQIFDYDFDGNHVGVRRFATIIEDEKGNFLHLLSIAEAALPVKDAAEKIAQAKSILDNARAILQNHIAQENGQISDHKKHELGRPKFGQSMSV